ncbi:MAG: hypothetical protein OEU09_05045 [Rhodospirillales bacterium]|nr:hypothetical protein [Rhodospirillales bacterium]MDH3910643.1 hypothetical protein [Rhodospirillales bacterium]MDH3918201.1 hypothetical protein [Rhodospirillales bacterium]MDH3965556.1 hypothetical protein [Rhodospirillales bacterium]
MIDFTGSAFFSSTATALVRLAQAAARPNFELQFNIAQNTALARLDKEIEAFQDDDFGRGKTALLRVKATRLDRELAEAKAYKTVVASNRLTVKDALDQLDALRALADPASVSEFEAKRSELLETLDKLRTATTSRLGAPDGLRQAKADGLAAIEAIVTNDFATPADIQAAQDTIDGLAADFTESLSIVEINQDLTTNLVKSVDRSLDEARLKIDDIEIAERKQQIDKIQALQERTATILTSVSLAFEGAQALSDFIAQNTVLPQEIEPGSVLNLFA